MLAKRRVRMIMGGLVLLALGLAAPAMAREGLAAEPRQPAQKLARGLQNSLLGWTEIVSRPQTEVAERGVPGLVTGLPDGVAHGTVRTMTGAAEAATFWSPLPVKYEPPIQPPRSPLDRR